jgi:hypothetical protein
MIIKIIKIILLIIIMYYNKINTIKDVPKFCVEIIEKLKKEEVFNGTGYIPDKIKMLPIESYDLARVCELISKFDGNYSVYASDRLIDKDGIPIKNAVELWLYKKRKRISPMDLEKSFNEIIKKIQTGWKQSTLQENELIFFEESEKDHYLFIKDENFNQEENFIAVLASVFGFFRSPSDNDRIFHIGNQWLNEDPKIAVEYTNKTYLWIKKDKIKEFNEKFDFSLGIIEEKPISFTTIPAKTIIRQKIIRGETMLLSRHLENDPKKLQVYYDAIHEIRTHLESIDKDKVLYGFTGWPSPNPFYDRTVDSLVLEVHDYIQTIYSPFGEVKISGGGWVTELCNASNLFLKTMDWDIQKLNKSQIEFSHLLFHDDDDEKIPYKIEEAENLFLIKRVGKIQLLPLSSQTKISIYLDLNIKRSQYKKDKEIFDIVSNKKDCF